MWGIIFQIGAAILVGGAVGYGVGKIIQNLSKKFAEFWKELVATAKDIWGYVTEATEYCFAQVAQLLNDNWSDIRAWLHQALDTTGVVWTYLYKQGENLLMSFVSYQGKSASLDFGVVSDKPQLPTQPLWEQRHQLTLS